MNGPRYAFRVKHQLDRAEKALDDVTWRLQQLARLKLQNLGVLWLAEDRRKKRRVERLRRIYQKAMLAELARALKQRKSALKRAGK